MKNNIEIQLDKIKVKKLSEHEQHELWQTIVNQLPAKKHQNILFPLLLKPRVMLGIFIALMLTLGGTATVQAANSSAPGDILFPLDRTIENIQLKIASDTKKEELKVKFSQERIDEINHIITEIETDGNMTIDQSVKVTSTSTVSATSSDFIDERLQNALGVALHFINQTKLDLEASGNSEAITQINQLLDDLGNDLQNLSSGAKYKLKLESNDDKLRFEIKSKEKGEEKVELRLRSDEEKNRLQIKSREDKFELELETDDDSVQTTSSVSSVARGLTEAEVKIYTASSSMVKVEFNNQSSSFMLASSDRETIIAAIMSKYNVTRQAVEAVLKIEIMSNTSTSGSTSSTSSQGSGGQSNNSNDDNVNTNRQNGSVFIQSIEAEVRQNKTRVRVKYQGQNDQEFNLAVLSRSELVSALAIKYHLPELVIEGLLKFEVSE